MKELTDLDKVYEMDHDFVCIANQRNTEFEQYYLTGLRYYIEGDWGAAMQEFKVCQEKVGVSDGPLNHMLRLMDKMEKGAWNMGPWNEGYDWDLKPVPPEVDYFGQEDSEDFSMAGSQKEGK